MAILVTGGAGYIGSVTVEMLQAHGEQPIVLDDLSRGHRASVLPNVPFYEGRIGDRALLEQIVREHEVNACIHFAALTFVGESTADPARYFSNNVEQGIALMEILVKAGVQRVVFSSTAATYGEPQRVPISEDHPQWPTNPYGWSKLFMERLLESFDRAYGLRFVALRYFNAAGATARCGEDHTPEYHLLPNVLAVADGRLAHVSVFGNNYPTPDGTAIRDYIHVADLGAAHLAALRYLAKGGASEFINLGNGQGYSVLEVIETARRVTERNIPMRIEPPRVGDTSRLIANAEKARRLLEWNPAASSLEQIIRSAWEWYKSHPQGYNPK